MRIGIFDPYLDTLGGGEKYMLTAASCLSEKNDVFLFWDEDLLKKASKKFDLDLSKVQQAKNIFNPNFPLLKRYFESGKYDAIFFLSDGSIPFIKGRLYVHFQFPVEWVNTKSFISRKKISRINKFICNSKFTKSFIDEKFSVQSEVLYPPTYVEKKIPKVDFKKKKNYILNVGRLSRLPNGKLFKKQDFLIDAFKKIVDSGVKDWNLLIVLSYNDQDKKLIGPLKAMAKGYPIKIFENISYERLNDIYKKSKIYWHASGFGENLIKHPEKAEHFGITTVEAMANGLAPVVINEGGQKEIVDDGKDGFLFDSEKELILNTKKLMENNILEEISNNAVNKAKNFTTDRFCKEIYKIFEL